MKKGAKQSSEYSGCAAAADADNSMDRSDSASEGKWNDAKFCQIIRNWKNGDKKTN